MHPYNCLAGGPAITYDIIDYSHDINRGENKEERLDKMYQLLEEAKKKNHVVTFNSANFPPEFLKKYVPERLLSMSVNDKGIKYNYCYTMLDIKTVTLANNYTDIILLLRNPSGKNEKGEEWLGDWGIYCDLWTKFTKH
jgi:Calpain family cysteine protease